MSGMLYARQMGSSFMLISRYQSTLSRPHDGDSCRGLVTIERCHKKPAAYNFRPGASYFDENEKRRQMSNHFSKYLRARRCGEAKVSIKQFQENQGFI